MYFKKETMMRMLDTHCVCIKTFDYLLLLDDVYNVPPVDDSLGFDLGKLGRALPLHRPQQVTQKVVAQPGRVDDDTVAQLGRVEVHNLANVAEVPFYQWEREKGGGKKKKKKKIINLKNTNIFTCRCCGCWKERCQAPFSNFRLTHHQAPNMT